VEAIAQLEEAMLSAYLSGNTIFMFGNGGSGATASHIAGDFVKGASYGLERRFKCICLNDNNASLMAIANDISYDAIFVEPLKNFLQAGDLVIGFSGSGNSTNVVQALEYARAQGAKTVAMCGFKGGKIKDIAHIVVHAPVMDMEVTEDVHLIVFHALKQNLIAKLHAGGNTSMGSVYDARVQ
jgi:D-sedoheptulose 7-phosphate isomerase